MAGMANPSIALPDDMIHEIEERREKGTNRSEYIRAAIVARFDAEDSGEWEDVDDPIQKPADD